MSRFNIRERQPRSGKDELPAGLHPAIRRILLARGLSSSADLELELPQLLTPDSLGGTDHAADLLATAITAGQSILVVGDFDADGATGTAVAVLGLRAMGCKNISFRVPNRFEFGYGLTVPLVETLVDAPPDVLVTVDSGIACIAGVARARELGCQVIVTDHHLPGPELPAAHAIVNPNAPGDTFPSKAMAGVGVMFYLLSKVRQALRERGWFDGRSRREPNLASLLDLVALGTVADLVPLDRNNRILVKQGLARIRQGQARPGLMALLRAGNRDYRFAQAADMGFAVAPRLNAAGRLEDMSVGIRCLLSDDIDEANALARQLDELNQQRKDMQEDMQAGAMQQVQELIASLGSELPSAVCLFDPEWHQGIVGLVASRVKDSVHRPVIAFAPESVGADKLKGSARSVSGLHIRDVLALVESRKPGLMTAFGGHAMAAGLSLPQVHLDEFKRQLQAAVITVLNGDSLDAEILTDGELPGTDLNLGLALELEALGPWGQRFPEPLFDGRFEVAEQRVVGGSHLKLKLRPYECGSLLDAIAFNCAPEQLGNGQVRALYRLDINRWRGMETCQLRIERIVTA
ncbi:MAG TPA: single-stranded-DNA-specific exonuclease RecJ [Xanthomonadales bacterium]|nr:single-stranded-DNA-specific exonuclease RecJ [Xanthomonadales bacterium]